MMSRLPLCLCLLILAAGCTSGSSQGEEPRDGHDGPAEDAEYAAADAGDDGGDTATEDTDGPDHGFWGWCPDASAYIGGVWSYSAVVTDEALFCVVNQGGTVEEAMGNKAQMRLVPGMYPLPDADGTYAVMLPACIRVPGAEESRHEGAGIFTVTTHSNGAKSMQYDFTQPMRVGTRQWDIGMDALLYFPGDVPPQLVIDNQLNRFENGTEITVRHNLGVEGFDRPWLALPCDPAAYNPRVTAASFDRGSLTVEAEVYSEVAYGGHAPAILRRGHGQLDGVSFEQQDYDRLSHLPAHHNWGGSFLVMFDEPIGLTCGIKLDVPSVDGGGPLLGAWTVDCDLAFIKELAGLVIAPP